MNFGYKILITLILFVAGMLTMVGISMRQTNDMLDDNYYEREKSYQELIDAENALQEIRKHALVDQNSTQIIIHLPENSYQNIENAAVQFIKPDNQNLDISFDLIPNDEGVFLIDKSKLAKGMYKVRVKWENDTRLYYDDNNFYIQ